MKNRDSSRSGKWRRWLAALAMVAASFAAIGVPTAANAATVCPLHNVVYSVSNTNASHVDSYGLWANPDIGFVTKVGGSTCGDNVYISNLIGPFEHPVYARVWYEKPSIGYVNSHNPVTVPMTSSYDQNYTLYNLGNVPAGYIYIIEVLSTSTTPGITGAGCLNTINGGITTPCFARERG